MGEERGKGEQLYGRSKPQEYTRIRVSEHVSADGVRIILRRPPTLKPEHFAVGGSKAAPNEVIIKHQGQRIYKHQCDFPVDPRCIKVMWRQGRREMHIAVRSPTRTRYASEYPRHEETAALLRGYPGQTNAMVEAQRGASDVIYRDASAMSRHPHGAPGARAFTYPPTAPSPVVQSGGDAVSALLSLQTAKAPATFASNGDPMAFRTMRSAAPGLPQGPGVVVPHSMLLPPMAGQRAPPPPQQRYVTGRPPHRHAPCAPLPLSVADTMHMHLDAAARAMRMMHQMRVGPPAAPLAYVPRYYHAAPPQRDLQHHHR